MLSKSWCVALAVLAIGAFEVSSASASGRGASGSRPGGRPGVAGCRTGSGGYWGNSGQFLRAENGIFGSTWACGNACWGWGGGRLWLGLWLGIRLPRLGISTGGRALFCSVSSGLLRIWGEYARLENPHPFDLGGERKSSACPESRGLCQSGRGHRCGSSIRITWKRRRTSRKFESVWTRLGKSLIYVGGQKSTSGFQAERIRAHDALVLAMIAATALSGCQHSGQQAVDPFWGRTTVPSPATGSIGAPIISPGCPQPLQPQPIITPGTPLSSGGPQASTPPNLLPAPMSPTPAAPGMVTPMPATPAPGGSGIPNGYGAPAMTSPPSGYPCRAAPPSGYSNSGSSPLGPGFVGGNTPGPGRRPHIRVLRRPLRQRRPAARLSDWPSPRARLPPPIPPRAGARGRRQEFAAASPRRATFPGRFQLSRKHATAVRARQLGGARAARSCGRTPGASTPAPVSSAFPRAWTAVRRRRRRRPKVGGPQRRRTD